MIIVMIYTLGSQNENERKCRFFWFPGNISENAMTAVLKIDQAIVLLQYIF